MMADNELRRKLINEVRLLLGGGMVNVELTPEHYDLAVDMALDRYRQRSSNAVEERVTFLELQPEQQEYYLPKEIMEVIQIYRRGTSGTSTGTGANFDPFGAAFVNQTAVGLSGGSGSLLTYELYAGFLDTVGRLFGHLINFSWNPTSKVMSIVRNITSRETVLLHVYMEKPETMLFSDQYARPWLRDYTLARCKIMLGEARGKFNSIVGPQGGTTLNGDALKSEGLADIERLDNEINTSMEQSMGYGFILG